MTEKQQLTLNQENMIKLALMYEDYELEKMLGKLIDIGLAHSAINLYVKDYYLNLYKRLKNELKTLLDCVTYEEVFTRSYKVYDTWSGAQWKIFLQIQKWDLRPSLILMKQKLRNFVIESLNDVWKLRKILKNWLISINHYNRWGRKSLSFSQKLHAP